MADTVQVGLRLQEVLVRKYKKRALELSVNYLDLMKIVLAKGVDSL